MSGCCSSFGKTVREHLESQGHRVFGYGLGGPHFVVDLADPEMMGVHGMPEATAKNIYSEALHFFGETWVDCLINNAGITEIDFLENHTLDQFEKVIFVNLTWPFVMSKFFLSYHRARPIARIINVSSMGATVALRASPGYCAAKAGLEMLTKQMAKEFAQRHHIMTCCIAPGGVDDTGMVDQAIRDLQRTRGMTQGQAEAYNRQSPLGRNMTHGELVAIFDFAVNTMPQYMSGTILKCTGAMGV